MALRKAKIVYNFGLSECNRVKSMFSCNANHLFLISHKHVALQLAFGDGFIYFKALF